jgi:hypothetical protein
VHTVTRSRHAVRTPAAVPPPAPAQPDGAAPGPASGAPGLVLFLLAVATAAVALVPPRAGRRLRALVDLPHSPALALELERPG